MPSCDFSKKTENSLNDISFFDLKYEYLNDSYLIDIDSVSFMNLILKYRFSCDQIKTFKDSLYVIFIDNFEGDTEKSHKAKFQIGYTWKRLSYHLWISEDETKKLASRFGFSHPYLFKSFMIENFQREDVQAVLKSLKEKVQLKFYNKSLSTKSPNELLNTAMRHNPERIRDYELLSQKLKTSDQLIQLTNSTKVCKKQNCCRSKSQ